MDKIISQQLIRGSLQFPQPSGKFTLVSTTPKDLLAISDLSEHQLRELLDLGQQYQSEPLAEDPQPSLSLDFEPNQAPCLAPPPSFPATLKGQMVLTLFYEPSTRTRSSFAIAAKRLGADVTNFSVSTSSVVKGESVLDTIETLQAMRADYIVVRHQASGVPQQIARHTQASVINAGDGWHAHPTQALLDALTLLDVFAQPTGQKVLIAGDIQHSRVARSTSQLMHRLGFQVAAVAPGTLLPQHRPDWLRCFATLSEALQSWQPAVIYLLRMQQERMEEQLVPNLHEYHRFFGVNDDTLSEIQARGLYLMHPGPVNRGVELSDMAMEYPRSLINRQVENGIAARMAVLDWLQPRTSQTTPKLA